MVAMKFSGLVVLSALFVSFLHAAPPPVRLTSAGASLSNPKLSDLSRSRGFFPCPPPGFRTEVVQDKTKKLKLLDVYLVTATYIFANHYDPWDGAAGPTIPFSPGYVNIAIYYISLAGSGVTLTNGMVLLGLWDGIAAISELGRYESTVVKLFSNDIPIGEVWITTKYSASQATINNATSRQQGGDNAKVLESSKTLKLNSHDEDSGRFILPSTPELSIAYDFEGPKIKAVDMLTAIIQGLIIVSHDARRPRDQAFSHINAASASGHCAFNLHEVAPEGKNIDNVAMMLIDLSRMLTDWRRFQSMDLALERKKSGSEEWTKLVKGYFMWLEPAGRSQGRNITTA